MIARLACLSASLLVLGCGAEVKPRSSAEMIEAVNAKMRPCWEVPTGEPAQFVVVVRVWMRPDGTPATAEIVDKEQYESDLDFRAAADAAYRTVMNPHCQPLPLDPKHYDEWKVIIFRFDPRTV